MKSKFIYLFLALLLPGVIFVFLKLFGRNEFAVEPLYQSTAPVAPGCVQVQAPYYVPDSVLSQLNFRTDSLVAIVFHEKSDEGIAQLNRVKEEVKGDPIHLVTIDSITARTESWKQCSFFLKEPFNTVLVDYKGRIRGEYTMRDRKEIDRLLTEITIILKKY